MTDRSQWLRGVTDVLVLGALRSGRSYGYELVERFTAAGLADLNEATVYGSLRRLEAAGLLSSSLRPSKAGPARRYYELTADGRRAAKDQLVAWREFTATVDRAVHGTESRSAGREAAS